MVQEISPQEIRQRMAEGQTFVVNVVATWCPDCVERQRPNFSVFSDKMAQAGVPVYQCTVQEEKLVFLSPEHEELTASFGGHGYPRTTLIVRGEVVESRVEVMDALALAMLAHTFRDRIG